MLRDPQDIGGPMQKNEAYRRNVNVLTYGFDKSFIDYFGQPGVDAVEAAIKTLNDVPPASRINVNRYPTNTMHHAEDVGVVDLKLVTLHALLQQLGSAAPTRYVWTLRQMDYSLLPWFLTENNMSQEQIDFCMLKLNYDPRTFQASRDVNELWFTFDLVGLGGPLNERWISYSRLANVGSMQNVPIADGKVLGADVYCTGLTRDDVGALKYLLSSSRMCVEPIDPSIYTLRGRVHPPNTLRPGVEKIWFFKHPTDRAGNFRTLNIHVSVPDISRGSRVSTPGLRHIVHPDILFSAAGLLTPEETWPNVNYSLQFFRSTDTSHWRNMADLNHNVGGDGPGVICGRTQITFQTNTAVAWPAGAHYRWGQFLNETNVIVFGSPLSN